MKDVNEEPAQKQDQNENKNPSENNSDDARKKNQKPWRGEGPQGPNYNIKSKDEDGNTSNNAGTFK